MKFIFNFFKKRKFKVVAIITMYNEELFISRCIEHLRDNGVDCYIVDNESTDDCVEIVKKYLGKGVLQIETLKRDGCFSLEKILKNEEKIAKNIDADWIMHHDADEIRMAPLPYKTLKDAIYEVNKQGYNAINFDEFVFVPTNNEESFEERDYTIKMNYYYYFKPSELHRVNVWKQNKNIDLVSSGGHCINFDNIKIYPQNFILRHYIALSKKHAIKKYCNKKFSEEGFDKKWHGNRRNKNPKDMIMPPKDILKKYNHNKIFDKSDPWIEHYFLKNNS